MFLNKKVTKPTVDDVELDSAVDPDDDDPTWSIGLPGKWSAERLYNTTGAGAHSDLGDLGFTQFSPNFGVSTSPTPGTFSPMLGTSVASPQPGFNVYGSSPCQGQGHQISPSIARQPDGMFIGYCTVCLQTVHFEALDERFDYERAGVILGRAIGADAEETNELGTIMAELDDLASRIEKESRKLQAASDLLQLGMGILKKKMIADATERI